MSHQPVLSAETQALLRRIAEEVPDPVAVLLSPDWRVVYANRSCRALSAAHQLGERLADLLPGAAAAEAIERLEEARRTGRTVSCRARPLVVEPGRPTGWWDIDRHPLPAPQGGPGAVLVILRDVTAEVTARQEAAAATAALARRAEQMRHAFDAGRMFFWDLDLLTGRIECSGGLEEACGLAPGSFAGTLEAFRALVDPEDLPRVEAALAAALAGRAAYDIEFRMRRADGSARWLLARGTVLRDAGGCPVRMVGIDVDLTERERRDAALVAAAALLRRIRALAGGGLGDWDRRVGLQRRSDRPLGLHGFRLDRGAPDVRAGPDPGQTQLRLRLRRTQRDLSSGEEGHCRAIDRIDRADERRDRRLATPGRVSGAAPDGQPLRRQGASRDGAAFLSPPPGQLPPDRGDQAAFLRSVLDASTDCTKVVEPDGTLSFMNGNGLCLMEIEDFAPLRGTDWAGFWPEEVRPRVRQALAAALAGRPDRFEAFCPTARGAPRWWDVVVAPVRDAAGRVVRAVATSRDISALKRIEARLQDAVATRETLMQEADHRIKNSLQMTASLLRMQQGRTADPAVAAALGQATARVLSVAEAHRSLCRSPDLRSVDLSQLLRDLAGHLRGLSPEVDVRCTSAAPVPLDAERGIPLGLLANELLTNAVRHAYPDGAPGLVEAGVAEQDGEIVLTIADAGRGLPAGEAAAPAGLGLLLVRSLARQAGAAVGVETAPGRGTRVTLRLPRRPDAAGPAPG